MNKRTTAAMIVFFIITFCGIVGVRYYAWSVAHPNAPTWTFFLGG